MGLVVIRFQRILYRINIYWYSTLLVTYRTTYTHALVLSKQQRRTGGGVLCDGVVLDSYFIYNFSFISFKLAVLTHLTVLAVNNITDGRTKKWDQKESVPLYDIATQVRRNRMRWNIN